jgi:hypothetical protein
MISAAETRLGNIGEEPYWSWYGFSSRVEWCACFVNWCAEQCGFIDAGVLPRFFSCEDGIGWCKDKGQWWDGVYTPAPGDIIFKESPTGFAPVGHLCIHRKFTENFALLHIYIWTNKKFRSIMFIY